MLIHEAHRVWNMFPSSSDLLRPAFLETPRSRHFRQHLDNHTLNCHKILTTVNGRITFLNKLLDCYTETDKDREAYALWEKRFCVGKHQTSATTA